MGLSPSEPPTDATVDWRPATRRRTAAAVMLLAALGALAAPRPAPPPPPPAAQPGTAVEFDQAVEVLPHPRPQAGERADAAVRPRRRRRSHPVDGQPQEALRPAARLLPHHVRQLPVPAAAAAGVDRRAGRRRHGPLPQALRPGRQGRRPGDRSGRGAGRRPLLRPPQRRQRQGHHRRRHPATSSTRRNATTSSTSTHS